MSESIASPQDAPKEQSPQTTSASPSPASKIHEEWKDDSLDALLVSSDGVGFYVPAYKLQAHSTAFCDIITDHAKGQSSSSPSSSNSKGASGNTHHTLELTDDSFETSIVVAWVLQLMDGTFDVKAFVEANKAKTLPILLNLKSFANKWDCRLVLDGLERAIVTISSRSSSEPFSKLEQFDILRVASNIDRPFAAYSVLLLWDMPEGSDGEKREYAHDNVIITKRKHFAINTLSKRGFNYFSPDYLYAFYKSSKKHAADQRLRADEFLRLISE
ncbi:hypothetical protein, variant 2 [Cryptococcus amylolentus CBS 6039]|nr:hypothetical protein, variant 1 [Cryptococcus amylolentus CBS 6039]XP_018991362.1 hypothetical protein, variant 2 [Cryptococcus amylolentus CBS 6039]ODN75830.1 hypothetical protein, variant 1 [Cryptococcus amylolentus CBS 6039]ODN75831.1 hypothetical protein, variant 2 [Cryptococcus amylolentus CBS 6039]ODN96990.1 hypothetical protein I350_07967 [Cryptococcus amylolentus CBS 6273]